MTALRIEGLTKRFEEVTAVSGLDLDIAQGELIALLGPSGCGKTTTLRCIAGFEQPDEGSIFFADKDVVALPPERRNIGMVFQDYALFPHMTVFRNISFGLEMRHVSKGEARERILKVLETVQLSGLEERYPRQLSGGQQQRVALARALVIEPNVLLLDEPLANLDAKLREEMRFFIRQLQKRIGITTVYVTHDQAESMVIADRIVVMFGGQALQIGTPYEIYAQPRKKQVADFIGLSNFLTGTVNGVDSDNTYRLDTNLGAIRCKYQGQLEPGEAIVIALRPESIHLERQTTESPELNTLPGTVQERYYLGNANDYKINCGGGNVIRVQERPGKVFKEQERLFISFPVDQAWIIRE